MGWREIIQGIAAIGIFLSFIVVFVGTFVTGTPFSSLRATDIAWFVISLLLLIFGLLNIPMKKMLSGQYFPFYIATVIAIGCSLYLVLEDNFGLAALFGGLAVIALIAGKVGNFIWTDALLPILTSIPLGIGTAIGNHYAKKVLEKREKKSLPDTPMTQPAPAISQVDSTKVKPTRKQPAPSPQRQRKE